MENTAIESLQDIFSTAREPGIVFKNLSMTYFRINAYLLQPTGGEVTVSGDPSKTARLKQKYGKIFHNPVLLKRRAVNKVILTKFIFTGTFCSK